MSLNDSETKAFWMSYEEATGEIIPNYLKNLITAAGYARYSAVKSIEDRLITSLESFAREQMPLFFETTSEVFHVYHKYPERFKIVPGHIELLKEGAEKLPDVKAFMKVYRKNCLRYDKTNMNPSETVVSGYSNKVTENVQLSSQLTNGLAKDDCFKLLTEKYSEKPAEAAAILKKIIRWANSKNIKLKQDPEIAIYGPRQIKVKCCMCEKSVSLSSRMNRHGSYGWIISNFTHHLQEHERKRSTAIMTDFFGRARNHSDDHTKEHEDCKMQDNRHQNSEDLIEYDPQIYEELQILNC